MGAGSRLRGRGGRKKSCWEKSGEDPRRSQRTDKEKEGEKATLSHSSTDDQADAWVDRGGRRETPRLARRRRNGREKRKKGDSFGSSPKGEMDVPPGGGLPFSGGLSKGKEEEELLNRYAGVSYLPLILTS